MKGNNGSGNNPSRDEWETPSWLFKLLSEQYAFEFDCCATQQNTKTKDFSERDFQDITEIDRVAWMNPPFSKAYAIFKHFFKIVKRGVAIYRCDNMETRIWQEVILPQCSWVFIPDKRIYYDGFKGDGARFPSALIGIGVEPPKNLKGITLWVKQWK